MKYLDRMIVFITLLMLSAVQCADHFSETLIGSVGGGNYSYYLLSQPGMVVLYLKSFQGDADLYVSSKSLKPTFDLEDHDFQSTTCGSELVSVPSTFPRPLSIAVYGHPSHESSLYELKIDVHDVVLEKEEFPDYAETYDSRTNQLNKQPAPSLPVKEEEFQEKSLFWTLLLNILQVLIDMLVD